MATQIPTVVAGTVATPAEFNTLAQLNTQIGLGGASGALSGGASLPSTVLPAFIIQAGAVTVTTGPAGTFTVNFPNPFPIGVIGAWGINFESTTGIHCWIEINVLTNAAVSFIAYDPSGPVASSPFEMCWLAIGF